MSEGTRGADKDKTLITLHELINNSWHLIKTYNNKIMQPTWGTAADYKELIQALDKLSFIGDTAAQKELSKTIAIAIYKYLDTTRQTTQHT